MKGFCCSFCVLWTALCAEKLGKATQDWILWVDIVQDVICSLLTSRKLQTEEVFVLEGCRPCSSHKELIIEQAYNAPCHDCKNVEWDRYSQPFSWVANFFQPSHSNWMLIPCWHHRVGGGTLTLQASTTVEIKTFVQLLLAFNCRTKQQIKPEKYRITFRLSTWGLRA